MKKRMLLIVLSICIVLTSCLGRIGFISKEKTKYVLKGNNTVSVTVDINEVNLYYSDMSRLTNNSVQKCVVIRPTEKDIKELYKKYDDYELRSILEELKDEKPVVKYVNKSFNSKILNSYYIVNSDYICHQLIDKESSGLLKHIPESKSSLKIRYNADANGRILSGDKGELINNNYYSNEGLKLTLNKEIEKIVYASCSELKSGCAIVMDVNDSSILSVVNKPDNSFMNKAFSQYSVGSVFKIVTSLCALENSKNPEYDCKGKIKVGDTEFSCQNNKKHGKQSLRDALANSCNCYFVNLALILGGRNLINTAEKLGFNDYTRLNNGWTIKNARINKNKILSSSGETALFAFGQGGFTSTPLQICNLLCTVANEGEYNNAFLVSDEIDERLNFNNVSTSNSQQAISKYSSNIVLDYLRNVVKNGTGMSADYNNQCAGKTATAQTGQFVDGKEVLTTWFAGVYPYSNPKYAIVIMCDNGSSGAADCCPIFRDIVSKLK